jgi:hypothetical protein
MSTARYCTLHLSLSLRDSKSTNKFKSIAQKLFAPIKEDFLQNQISPRGDEENSCSPEELEKNKNKNKKNTK